MRGVVYVIGIRSCAPLASFLGFYLNLVCDNVSVVDVNSSSEIFEQLIRINEHDVIIGISFPRYSMRTLKALEFASNRKAKVITLTDSVHSPMNLYSSCNLIARSDMASIVDSLVAPLSVIDTTICMGASISSLHGMEKAKGKEYIKNWVAVIGDSTFLHTGINSLMNMVYNHATGTVLILDNSTTGMTGHQDHAATGKTLQGDPTYAIDIPALCRAVGVKKCL